MKENLEVNVSGGRTSAFMAHWLLTNQLGNCVTCFKKSKAKLNAVWWDDPKHFDWPARMEREHGHIRPAQDPSSDPKNFYRDRKTAKLLTQEFRHLNNDNRARWRAQEDEDGACSESCEPFEMEIKK